MDLAGKLRETTAVTRRARRNFEIKWTRAKRIVCCRKKSEDSDKQRRSRVGWNGFRLKKYSEKVDTNANDDHMLLNLLDTWVFWVIINNHLVLHLILRIVDRKKQCIMQLFLIARKQIVAKTNHYKSCSHRGQCISVKIHRSNFMHFSIFNSPQTSYVSIVWPWSPKRNILCDD